MCAQKADKSRRNKCHMEEKKQKQNKNNVPEPRDKKADS